MAVALPLLFVFLWSTGYVVAALVAPYAEPLSILTLRFAGAAGLLFLFGLLSRGRWPTPRRAGVIILSGTLIHGLYLSAVFWGIKHGMPAGISALLIGLQPLVTALLASPLLGEVIRPRHWLGLLIGLGGCALVISPKFTLDATGITPATLIAHAVAVLAIVLGSLFQKRYVGVMNFKTEPGLQLIGGLLIALPIALMTEQFAFTYSPSLAFGYAWMTLILSCGAFTLYMYLLQQGEASKVASVFYLVPVSSAIQGYILFHEVLTPIQIVGMAITTAAVALASDFFFKKTARIA
ncbi:MAG: DMT family transporter [Rhizobiales bacterium]|nr:DMT family transporter [Hyphomicrobiales bacterium]